mmetsp:Transcript_36889/g.33145  ORF Transcript_36889/g.33145 Transcript_36889/m.33145 type:complete len:254 (-) Transcript_36889:193-954(-)
MSKGIQEIEGVFQLLIFMFLISEEVLHLCELAFAKCLQETENDNHEDIVGVLGGVYQELWLDILPTDLQQFLGFDLLHGVFASKIFEDISLNLSVKRLDSFTLALLELAPQTVHLPLDIGNNHVLIIINKVEEVVFLHLLITTIEIGQREQQALLEHVFIISICHEIINQIGQILLLIELLSPLNLLDACNTDFLPKIDGFFASIGSFFVDELSQHFEDVGNFIIFKLREVFLEVVDQALQDLFGVFVVINEI